MKILKIVGSLAVLLLVVLVFAAPIGPMPGVLIGGKPSEVPATWGDTSNIHEISLEVPGILPRVVIIWVVQTDGDLYVVGSKDSAWVSMLGDGSSVKMRMEGKTFPLNAVLIENDWEKAMESYIAKYQPDYPEIVGGFPSLEDAADSISVFRLSK